MAISKSTTNACTRKAGMKRARSVCFNNTVKHVLDNRRDDEQVRKTWYDKNELATFKNEVKTDLRMLLTGQVKPTESNIVSWRGLETYTKRNSKFHKHRRERRTFLVDGVKDLQRRLSSEGLPAEGALSKLSKIASLSSVQEARNQATRDSLDANQIYLETFLVPNAGDKLANLPPVVAPRRDIIISSSHQQLVTARTA